MLGKLIKHEFRATSREFVVLYVGILFLTLANKAFWSVDFNNSFFDIMQFLFMAAYVVVIMSMFIMPVVLVVARFYKNLLTDEGYLSFTIPVTAGQHIISKWIAAVVWTICTYLVMLLSVVLLFLGKYDLGQMWKMAMDFLDISPKYITLFWVMIFTMLVGVASGTLMYFASMALGQLSSKHKILGGIVAYFLLNTVVQMLTSGLMFMIQTLAPTWMDRINAGLEGNATVSEFVIVFLLLVCVLYILLGVAYFFITKYVLEKKLNLE